MVSEFLVWVLPYLNHAGYRRLAPSTRPPNRDVHLLAREDQHQPKRGLLKIVQDVIALWRYVETGVLPEGIEIRVDASAEA